MGVYLEPTEIVTCYRIDGRITIVTSEWEGWGPVRERFSMSPDQARALRDALTEMLEGGK